MIEHYYKRCYICIPLPKDFFDTYKNTQDLIKSRIKYISLEKIDKAHITLYYIGETVPEFIREIKNICKPLFNRYYGNSINIGKLKCFTDETPRTLFLDISHNRWLMDLNNELSEKLKTYNFQERAFTPHLTIARIRREETKRDYYENRSSIISETESISFNTEIHEIQIRGTNPTTRQLYIF